MLGVSKILSMDTTEIARILFDKEYFISKYGNSPNGDDFSFFLERGLEDLLDPAPWFSMKYYIERYIDHKDALVNPFIHYIDRTKFEFRAGNIFQNYVFSLSGLLDECRQEFDESFYRAQIDAGNLVDALAHYLAIGWTLGFDPSPAFSTSTYLKNYDDVYNSGICPLLHYIAFGRKEGRLSIDSIPTSSVNDLSEKELSGAAIAQIPDEVYQAFDPRYYLDNNPDLVAFDGDLCQHFCDHGWKELRKPCDWFDTRVYLEYYPDVRDAQVNPFIHYVLHGRFENRVCRSFLEDASLDYTPLVSIIVPNYNHSEFLEERIRSIAKQTYRNIELIVLDDASTDGSQRVIQELLNVFPGDSEFIPNEVNSGKIFEQWRKGFERAKGDLVWICESDDFCELDFLEKILHNFSDPSVMIAFGRVQFADASGRMLSGLDHYRERTEIGAWQIARKRSAKDWFQGAFGVANVIPNVGGCVIRRQYVESFVWDTAAEFRILGDWYLYLQLARNGQIAYEPSAVSYFRQHGRNTSSKSFYTEKYYQEHFQILCHIGDFWGISTEVISLHFGRLAEQYARFYLHGPGTHDLQDLFPVKDLMIRQRKKLHVCFGLLGFSLGGGEIFPIDLANEFVERGAVVSVLVLNPRLTERAIRDRLDSRIPVYFSDHIRSSGADSFVSSQGIDVFHSHHVGVDTFLFVENRLTKDVPYVSTLHGSYDVANINEGIVECLRRNVDHWVYLTPRNLIPISLGQDKPTNISFIANGAPIPDLKLTFSRETLGIRKDSLVFVVVSRAIPEKGWSEAIAAVRLARRATGKDIHIILCGSGPVVGDLRARCMKQKWVHLVGFVEAVHEAYRLGDCAILPSRFPGESYPLCLIQAMQVGKPIIATDIGEIRNMLTSGGSDAGLLVPLLLDDDEFVAAFAKEIVKMTNDDIRERIAANARVAGSSYSMSLVYRNYVELFQELIRRGSIRRLGVGSP